MNQNSLERGTVLIADPEGSVREETERLLRPTGATCKFYARAGQVLADLLRQPPSSHHCVVSEMRFADLHGLEFQRQLAELPQKTTLVFYVASARTHEVVSAMRAGAIGVVEKADDHAVLVEYVRQALETSRVEIEAHNVCKSTIAAMAELSTSERCVMRGILSGQFNKEIAQDLGISLRTVEQRRRDVFRKFNVRHPASLARKITEVAYHPSVQLHDRREFQSLLIALRDGNCSPNQALLRWDAQHTVVPPATPPVNKSPLES